ncbi:MAG: TIR domain-containing protein [Bacteroidia bacterium]
MNGEKLFHDIHGVIIYRSVDTGDIENGLLTDTVRQKIRDEYLRDSSVTVVLIGAKTWQRKHVDWEISSSIRDTEYNPRSGLLGILLPTYPGYPENKYSKYTIPPRLADNISAEYSKIYRWTDDPASIQKWVHDANIATLGINNYFFESIFFISPSVSRNFA